MTVEPFRLFRVTVARRQQISPSFVRLTFCGPDLATFADNGFDQRIKLVVPLAGRGIDDLPTGPAWYGQWRALPERRRNPIRTYTVRAVRAAQCEVDVDLVRHGDAGPASRWAGVAGVGDEAGLIGPDRRYDGDHGGIEFRPPPGAVPVLLAADETALPAAEAIVRCLPGDARGEVVIEVPAQGDVRTLDTPAGVHVSWGFRDGAAPGSFLRAACSAAAARLLPPPPHRATGGGAPQDEDPDDLLWDVPSPDTQGDAPAYAWLAGEAGVIRALRRHLLVDRGLPRTCVAAMGYWRQGRPEG